MRVVRRLVEPIWAEHPPGYEPEGFTPYDTGWTAIETRIVLNRFETYILRGFQAINSAWYEHVVWRAGRVACNVFGHHNVSCRGRNRCAREIAQRAR